MQFGGQLIFEGKNGLQWIKKDEETGLVEVCFENDDGGEIILSFDPQLLKTIMESTKEFFEKDEIVKNIRPGTCIVKPDLNLWIDDEDVSISVDWEGPDDGNPVIVIAGKRYGEIELGFNVNQARTIAQCCQKIIEVRESLNGLKKNKVISAKTESA